jgi:hypothetical protein
MHKAFSLSLIEKESAMRTSILAALFVGLLMAGCCLGQTTQPTLEGRLDYRASRSFERGDYATALPLLQKLAVELRDKPAKLNVTLDRIRVCEQSLATTTQPSSEPRKIHQRPSAGLLLDIAIKDLGNFEYDQEKGGDIPEDVKQLSGCKIRLKGFMLPIDQSVHLTRFALVPSLFSCCFGQPPQVQHTIIVTCPTGIRAELSADEVAVVGTLTVQEKKDDGYVVSIFEVAATSLKPVPN